MHIEWQKLSPAPTAVAMRPANLAELALHALLVQNQAHAAMKRSCRVDGVEDVAQADHA